MPNPPYVPKGHHGKMPKAPKGHTNSGKFDNASGCAVTAVAMLGGLVAALVGVGYGIKEMVS